MCLVVKLKGLVCHAIAAFIRGCELRLHAVQQHCQTVGVPGSSLLLLQVNHDEVQLHLTIATVAGGEEVE